MAFCSPARPPAPLLTMSLKMPRYHSPQNAQFDINENIFTGASWSTYYLYLWNPTYNNVNAQFNYWGIDNATDLQVQSKINNLSTAVITYSPWYADVTMTTTLP